MLCRGTQFFQGLFEFVIYSNAKILNGRKGTKLLSTTLPDKKYYTPKSCITFKDKEVKSLQNSIRSTHFYFMNYFPRFYFLWVKCPVCVCVNCKYLTLNTYYLEISRAFAIINRAFIRVLQGQELSSIFRVVNMFRPSKISVVVLLDCYI